MSQFACHFIGCGKSFTRQTHHDRHMRSHRALLESTLEPLPMSDTKEVFMKHLQIDPETYALMEVRIVLDFRTRFHAHRCLERNRCRLYMANFR